MGVEEQILINKILTALQTGISADITDRATRLLGKVYGSQGQQILQRESTYDLIVQLRSAGVEIDPRQIRTLTSGDVVDISDRATRLLGKVYEYFERNAAAIQKNYGASGVAPHAPASRWSYVVPAGRFAKIEFLEALICREAAPTTLGRVQVWFMYTRAGILNYPLRLYLYNAAVEALAHITITNVGIMFPGDSINAYTYDGSTGGTCEYDVSAGFVEFS